jgi:hypothetical protein
MYYFFKGKWAVFKYIMEEIFKVTFLQNNGDVWFELD